MKIRNSFVTNSSSSSFIIGIKNDVTFDEFKSYINIDRFHNFCIDYELSEEDEDLDKYFEDACFELYNKATSGLILDSWIVAGGEIFSDDLYEYPSDALIYYGCIENSDRIKVN